jgi:hypothetical protein
VWLLEQGVAPRSIQWIKPREGWWLNRKFQQPHTQVTEMHRAIAIQLEAMAVAPSMAELLARLEAEGVLLRIDRAVTPTMLRGAILSEGELTRLRTIEDVVRLGHVQRLERDAIVLERGTVPTNAATVHVHCAASALSRPPLRPIFEARRVTVQAITWGFACYQAAMQGVIEAVVPDDAEKNRLCAPIPYWDSDEDYLRSFLATMIGDQERGAHAQLRAWMRSTRLNPGSAIEAMKSDPRVQETRERIKRAAIPAALNVRRLLDGA